MSRNINAQAVLLTSVAATDVVYANGNLNVKGVASIPVKKITSASRIGQPSGSQIETNTITVNTATPGVTYGIAITQVIEGKTYTWQANYTAVTGDTTSTIADAVAAKIQAGIDGNQILGTQTSPSNTIVFVGTSVAPSAGIVVSSLMTNAKTYTVSWTAAGSTYTAGTSVLTGFSGLVTGDLYLINMGTGATGNNANYVNLQTLVGRAASASTMVLYSVPSDTLTTTGITGLTVLAEPAGGLEDLMTGTSGYSSTAPYAGYLVEFETSNGVEAGVNLPLAIIFNASDTNALAFDRALIAGLTGTSAFSSLNVLA